MANMRLSLVEALTTSMTIFDQESRPEDCSKQYLAGTITRTKRDIKLFKDWLKLHDYSTLIETMSDAELDQHLAEFYKGLRTKDGKPYNKQTLLGIRASINRYFASLPDSHRKSVLKQPEFNSSNLLLNQMERKYIMKIKKIMTSEDVKKMMLSDAISTKSPNSLVRKVWLDLTLHFGIKGKEAIRTLTKDSFVCEVDENGMKYVRFNQEKQMPKIEKFSEMHDWHWNSRMYEVHESAYCPVSSLLLYMSKISDTSEDFFQRPIENRAQISEETWYGGPMGHQALGKIMFDISEEAKLAVSYTNICLKATISKLLSQFAFMNLQSKLKEQYGLETEYLSSIDLLQNSYQLHKLLYGICYDAESP